MTNDDKQAAVPFSPQESSPELEEQVLEEITGGGKITDFLKGCVACGAPKSPVRELNPPPMTAEGGWTQTHQAAPTYTEHTGTAPQGPVRSTQSPPSLSSSFRQQLEELPRLRV